MAFLTALIVAATIVPSLGQGPLRASANLWQPQSLRMPSLGGAGLWQGRSFGTPPLWDVTVVEPRSSTIVGVTGPHPKGTPYIPKPAGGQLLRQWNKRQARERAAIKEAKKLAPPVGLAICPGAEGNGKCDQNPLDRVCVQVLEGDEWKPWGDGNYRDLTNKQFPEQGGDSICISFWKTASFIQKIGCDNVHIRCSATDTDFIMPKYSERLAFNFGARNTMGEIDRSTVLNCMKEKCGAAIPNEAYKWLASLPDGGASVTRLTGLAAAAGLLGAMAVPLLLARRGRAVLAAGPMLG